MLEMKGTIEIVELCKLLCSELNIVERDRAL